MPWKNTQMDFYKMCRFNKLASFTSTFCSGYPIICRKNVPIYEEDIQRSYSLPTTGCPPQAVARWRAWAIDKNINPAVWYISIILAAAQERSWYQWLYKSAAQESLSQRVHVQIDKVLSRRTRHPLCTPTKFRKTWNKTGSEKAIYMRDIMRHASPCSPQRSHHSSKSHSKQWNSRRSKNDSKRKSNDNNEDHRMVGARASRRWRASHAHRTRNK